MPWATPKGLPRALIDRARNGSVGSLSRFSRRGSGHGFTVCSMTRDAGRDVYGEVPRSRTPPHHLPLSLTACVAGPNGCRHGRSRAPGIGSGLSAAAAGLRAAARCNARPCPSAGQIPSHSLRMTRIRARQIIASSFAPAPQDWAGTRARAAEMRAVLTPLALALGSPRPRPPQAAPGPDWR